MIISKSFWWFIKNVEGISLTKYKDTGGKDTIGVGHLVKYPEDIPLYNVTNISNPLNINQITEEQAYELLNIDAYHRMIALYELFPDIQDQNIFDMLLSFGFNVGFGVFTNNESFHEEILNADWEAVARRFLKYSYVDGAFVKGLLIRRLKEASIILGEPILDPLKTKGLTQANINDILYTVTNYFKILKEESNK